MNNIVNDAGFNKYNLGCGDKFFKDYLNVGFWSHLPHNTAYINPNGVQGSILLNWDLTKGIPAMDQSLDVVYHSHFLEHLSYKDGWSYLQECHRVLKPGGVHRIIVPDLEKWIQAYVSNDSFLFDKYLKYGLDNNAHLYGTKAAIFMGMLHNHGHLCGWDFEMLNYVLIQTGFLEITRVMYQESCLDDIKEIEPYDSLRALESLCVECRR